MAELMFRLRSEYDVVIADSPPVLAVTDAMIVTTWAEAIIVVASFGRTTRKQLQSALDLLRQGDAHLAGTVLNRVARGEDEVAGYESYYYRPERGRRFQLHLPTASVPNNERSGSGAQEKVDDEAPTLE
jgi:Mrp family chromosome partitioning ATPase